MANKFIVFEAIDGSGTSTQAKMLVDYFWQKGEPASITSEPSSGPIGHMIRDFFKGRISFGGSQSDFDRMMAHLFAADRHDHLYNDIDGVLKTLKTHHVISTRYFYSSLAYHCKSESDFEFVYKINMDFPQPDVVIYIEIDAETAIKRMESRFVKDRYEELEKLQSVKNNYEKIFKDHFSDRVIRIDGLRTKDEVHKAIINSMAKRGLL